MWAKKDLFKKITSIKDDTLLAVIDVNNGKVLPLWILWIQGSEEVRQEFGSISGIRGITESELSSMKGKDYKVVKHLSDLDAESSLTVSFKDLLKYINDTDLFNHLDLDISGLLHYYAIKWWMKVMVATVSLLVISVISIIICLNITDPTVIFGIRFGMILCVLQAIIYTIIDKQLEEGHQKLLETYKKSDAYIVDIILANTDDNTLAKYFY